MATTPDLRVGDVWLSEHRRVKIIGLECGRVQFVDMYGFAHDENPDTFRLMFEPVAAVPLVGAS